ncbi:hypothetical protein pipiens_018137 [Culex pipiens pipiens]|uniref:Uncharacterized protein n=1 Tax=Culex pipiens pipiens TaxID=38569 RepID=A0ABD1CE91_CULPP
MNMNSKKRKQATQFLMATGDITFEEAREIIRESPSIIRNVANVPVPVRISPINYPSAGCTEKDFARIQTFILDAVFHRKAAYLLDLLLMEGRYVMVLTQNMESAWFVRSLIPKMKVSGLRVKVPTKHQINQFIALKLLNRSIKQEKY